MSMHERTGFRSLIYSQWHRVDGGIRKYLPLGAAAQLDMIDIDSLEVCTFCKRPVALIETQDSVKAPKSAKFTASLASMANIPAYSVSYTWDITAFQVQRIAPEHPHVAEYTPGEYTEFLQRLRNDHACSKGEAA